MNSSDIRKHAESSASEPFDWDVFERVALAVWEFADDIARDLMKDLVDEETHVGRLGGPVLEQEGLRDSLSEIVRQEEMGKVRQLMIQSAKEQILRIVLAEARQLREQTGQRKHSCVEMRLAGLYIRPDIDALFVTCREAKDDAIDQFIATCIEEGMAALRERVGKALNPDERIKVQQVAFRLLTGKRGKRVIDDGVTDV